MIIDAHTHILPQRRLDGLSLWLSQIFPNHPLAGKHFTVDSLLEELSRNGVEYIFNCVFPMKADETEGLNQFNHRLSEKFRMVIPFGSLHVENENKISIVDRCVHEFGFFGFKLHPYVQGFSPDDEKLFPAYERMEELGRIINVHTGFDDYYPKIEKKITLSAIEGLVKRFPSLVFIIPHMFYPRLEEGLYLLDNYENLYLDTTNIFSSIIQEEERGINRDGAREILTKTLNRWSERIMFGTDYPAGVSDADTIFSDFYSFNLDNKINQDLLYGTAYGFLERYGALNGHSSEVAET